MEIPRNFIIADLSIRKLESSSVLLLLLLYIIIIMSVILLYTIISTDEDPSSRIESSAIINLRGVSTKLYFNVYKLLNNLLGNLLSIFLVNPGLS